MTEIKQKKSIFWNIIICILSLIFIVMAFSWSYVWNYLEEYEKNNPQNMIETYLNYYRSGNYLQALKAEGVRYDTFNDESAYITYLKNKYGDKVEDIKAYSNGKDGDKLNYSIYIGDKETGNITLTPDGNKDKYGLVSYSMSIEKNYYAIENAVIYVPEKSLVYIDGKRVDDNYRSAETYSVEDFEGLDDENLIPKYILYEVKNLLNKPNFTVTDYDGNEMKVENRETGNYAVRVINEELESELKARTEEIAKKYAAFCILDLELKDISKYFVTNSDYYRKVKTYYNDWYREHTTSFTNEKFGEIVMYDDNHVVTDYSFTQNINIGYKTNVYNEHYIMSLVKIEGDWYVAKMVLK